MTGQSSLSSGSIGRGPEKQGEGVPFDGLIDPILIDARDELPLGGVVRRDHAATLWAWLLRETQDDAAQSSSDRIPSVLDRLASAERELAQGGEPERRVRVSIGAGPAAAMPIVHHALRHGALIEKARVFGRALNGIAGNEALAEAIAALPLREARTETLFMLGAIDGIEQPARLVEALVARAGGGTEDHLVRNGFGPVVEAMLSSAGRQLGAIRLNGHYADIDLSCRALERFHQLVRALSVNLDLRRGGRWANLLNAEIGDASDRIEPRLADVVLHVSRALRAPSGTDRMDEDAMLVAAGSLYLLNQIRDCRESLALNALFEKVWESSGQALDRLADGALHALRANPADPVRRNRVEAAISLSRIRHGDGVAQSLSHQFGRIAVA